MSSLFRKKDGSYWIIEKGKWYKIGKVSASTAKIAKGRFDADQTYLRLGMEPDLDVALPDLAAGYLEHQEKTGHKKPKSIKDEKERLGVLCREFGKVRLDKITPDKVQEFFKNQKYKPNTIRLYKQTLCLVGDFGVEKRYFRAHSFRQIKVPQIERAIPRFVDPDLIHKVLAVMKPETQLPYWIMYYTGMRPSEVLRLEQKDIDLKSDTILVRLSKTKRFRVIPIHPKLKKLLADKRSRLDLISINKHLKSALRHALTRLGLPEYALTPYQFRHTFATQVLSETKDLRAVQQLLGHTDIKTTTVYAHALPHALKSAVDSIK